MFVNYFEGQRFIFNAKHTRIKIFSETFFLGRVSRLLCVGNQNAGNAQSKFPFSTWPVAQKYNFEYIVLDKRICLSCILLQQLH